MPAKKGKVAQVPGANDPPEGACVFVRFLRGKVCCVLRGQVCRFLSGKVCLFFERAGVSLFEREVVLRFERAGVSLFEREVVLRFDTTFCEQITTKMLSSLRCSRSCRSRRRRSKR